MFPFPTDLSVPLGFVPKVISSLFIYLDQQTKRKTLSRKFNAQRKRRARAERSSAHKNKIACTGSGGIYVAVIMQI